MVFYPLNSKVGPLLRAANSFSSKPMAWHPYCSCQYRHKLVEPQLAPVLPVCACPCSGSIWFAYFLIPCVVSLTSLLLFFTGVSGFSSPDMLSILVMAYVFLVVVRSVGVRLWKNSFSLCFMASGMDEVDRKTLNTLNMFTHSTSTCERTQQGFAGKISSKGWGTSHNPVGEVGHLLVCELAISLVPPCMPWCCAFFSE